MRYMYARFKNYIGFFNGMGLYEMVLDLSKCSHRICIISGKNGSGKSTLLNSLHLLPDTSSSYIDGMRAEKELVVQDHENIYHINIVSPINGNGTRGVTKATIEKNGQELNPNGNIGSYKDIIFSEFDLDSNYIALSRLSTEDKGLVGKSPAERKRFFSNIIESLDTYNAMNKTFTKKANIFKSHLNTISSKISSIGDENTLRSSYFTICQTVDKMNHRILELEKASSEMEAYIKIADPDQRIQDRYQEIYQKVSQDKEILKQKEEDLISELVALQIPEESILEVQKTLEDKITNLQYEISNDERKMIELIDKQEEDLRVIEIKRQKIDNIKNDFDIESLKSTLENLKTQIAYQESILQKSQVTDYNISKSEYIHIFSTMKKIKNLIDIFKSKDISIIQETCDIIELNRLLELEASITEKNNFLTESIIIESRINGEIQVLKSNIESISILNDRPKGCKIDTCIFITKALELKKEKPEKLLQQKEKELDKFQLQVQNTRMELSHLQDLFQSVKELETILSMIEEDSMIDQLPVSSILKNRQEFLSRIRNSNTFNEIVTIENYIEWAEEIESYKENKNLYIKLEADWKIVKNKESLLEDLIAELSSIENRLKTTEEESSKLTRDISFNKNLMEEYENKLKQIKEIINMKEEIDTIKASNASLLEEYRSIKSNLENIKNYLDQLNKIRGELDLIHTDIVPLENQKKQLEYNITTLDDSVLEYNMYKEKYETVDKLKKYSSPSAEGIQTLFINIYMSKTLNLCNELLGMLFYGEYQLLPYIINTEEFRMPFIGTGMQVDDIMSGSSSQVAMMGLIINFVLLFQASTKYNIVGCDELDEALDTYNRLQYIQVLYRIIEILNIDQCFIISHSPEINRSDMDVIQLAEYNKEDCYGDGNIIYNYYDYIL